MIVDTNSSLILPPVDIEDVEPYVPPPVEPTPRYFVPGPILNPFFWFRYPYFRPAEETVPEEPIKPGVEGYDFTAFVRVQRAMADYNRQREKPSLANTQMNLGDGFVIVAGVVTPIAATMGVTLAATRVLTTTKSDISTTCDHKLDCGKLGRINLPNDMRDPPNYNQTIQKALLWSTLPPLVGGLLTGIDIDLVPAIDYMTDDEKNYWRGKLPDWPVGE